MGWRSMSTTRTLAAIGLVIGLVAGTVGVAAAGLPAGGSFSDDNGNVHEGNIEAIAAGGITKGCNPPDNTLYCPGASVTRGQMAAFLVRALDLPAASDDYFTDDDGTLFESNINRMAAAGITSGCNPPDNDLFCPNDNVTRGQMAAFLVRALDLTTTMADPSVPSNTPTRALAGSSSILRDRFSKPTSTDSRPLGLLPDAIRRRTIASALMTWSSVIRWHRFWLAPSTFHRSFRHRSPRRYPPMHVMDPTSTSRCRSATR